MAKEYLRNVTTPGNGKTVYIGSDLKNVPYKTESGEMKDVSLSIVYEIIERTSSKNGRILLVHDIEVNTFLNNLSLGDEEVIENYHAYGECEQYHSEFKTDMDFERLPSGKFATNALVLELSLSF